MFLDQQIKVDVFDINKIKVKMPGSISFGEMNIFLGKAFYLRFVNNFCLVLRKVVLFL